MKDKNRSRGFIKDVDKMKKALFLILAAAVLFDLVAGAYLMHLLDARKPQSAETKPGISKSSQPVPRTGTHSKPSYSMY